MATDEATAARKCGKYVHVSQMWVTMDPQYLVMADEMLSESNSEDCGFGIPAMKELNDSLLLFSLPPITDRTRQPRSSPTQGITLCILGSPKRYLDILLEGGDCCPEDMMIAISSTWLEKAPSGPNRNQPGSAETGSSQVHHLHLLVHKAIVFSRGGSTYLDVFNPPRRVTYFINDMPDVFDTADVECSMNGSQLVNGVLCDTLLWKIEMSRIGALLPPWVLLCCQPSEDFTEKVKGIKGGTIVELGAEHENEQIVIANLKEFMSNDDGSIGNKKINITKRIKGQTNVSSWSWKTHKDLVKQIMHDAEKVSSDDYIFVETIPVVRMHQQDRLWWRSPSTDQGRTVQFFNVSAHVSVSRGLDDQLLQSQIYASLVSTNILNTDPVYHTLETALEDIGITEVSQIDYIRMEINRHVRAVMDKVIDIETCYQGLYIGPRTDFLDIEFSLGDIKGIVMPILQAVRDQHTNLDVRGVDKWTRTPNYPARTIVHVMAMRSHCQLLKDRCMLILSTNLNGQKELWLEARKYGMKIILVMPTAKEETKTLVEMLIVYDFTDGTRNQLHANNILTLLKEKNCKISGCFSKHTRFSELAAMIRQEIGGRGPSLDACEKTYEKHLTYSTLMDTPSGRFVNKALRVQTIEEMEHAVKHIDFPAVVKLDNGSGAIGAVMVTDEQSCLKHYQNLLEEMKENLDVFELEPTKTSVILMKYIDGTEHTVDIVLFDGRLIGAFVRDVAPPSLPSFVSTALTLPSNLPKDKLNTLIRASLQICRDMGIADGCINVDMKMTTEGPKLLEINTRYGGHAIVPFAKQCFDEDLIILNYIICCGIRPTVVGLTSLRKAYALLMRASQHCEVLSNPWVGTRLKELNDKGRITYHVKRKIKKTSYDRVIAFIGTSDEDGEKAKQTLKTIAQTLGMDKSGFDCSYFLEHL